MFFNNDQMLGIMIGILVNHGQILIFVGEATVLLRSNLVWKNACFFRRTFIAKNVSFGVQTIRVTLVWSSYCLK